MSRGDPQTFSWRDNEEAGQGSEATHNVVATTGGLCLVTSDSTYDLDNLRFAVDDPAALMLAMYQTSNKIVLQPHRYPFGLTKHVKLITEVSATYPNPPVGWFGPSTTYGYLRHVGDCKCVYSVAEEEITLYGRDGTVIGSATPAALGAALADALIDVSADCKNVDTFTNYIERKTEYGW